MRGDAVDVAVDAPQPDAFVHESTTDRGMALDLALGASLALGAWVALVAAVLHGRYVVDAIAAGRYRKGPLARLSAAPDDGDEE